MSTAVHVGPLGPANLAALLALDAATNPHPWNATQWQDSLDHHHCLGLWLDHELAGFTTTMVTLDEAELLLIAVTPSQQHRSFGRQLLVALLKQLAGQQVQRLFLEVRASNHNAIAFYESLGFAKSGIRKGYYPVDTGREDALLYTHILSTKEAV